MPCRGKKKIEPAGKTLHDPGIKYQVIFLGHVAVYKEGWNRYLILCVLIEIGQFLFLLFFSAKET